MKTFSKKPGKETGTLIKCPCCGSEFQEHRKYYQYPLFSYVKCSKCSLVFQNPQPVFEDLSKRYDREYFDYEIENEDNFLNLMLKGLDDIDFSSLDFAEPRRILDVGCATGRLLGHFRENGWETSGVEICREAAEYGNRVRNVNISTIPLEKNSFPDNYFSFIHASHLIEHLNNPAEFLDEIYRILSPGGYSALVTPNIDGFQSRLFREKWRSAIADHMFLFSRKTLVKLGEKTGFSTVRTATWGGLAAGTAPLLIKKAADRIVKKTGTGDVAIVLFKKNISRKL